MAKEDVLRAVEKAIIKASRNLARGKRVSTEGLARLVSAYDRLQRDNGCVDGQHDALLDGDPDYYHRLYDGCGGYQQKRRLPR